MKEIVVEHFKKRVYWVLAMLAFSAVVGYQVNGATAARGGLTQTSVGVGQAPLSLPGTDLMGSIISTRPYLRPDNSVEQAIHKAFRVYEDEWNGSILPVKLNPSQEIFNRRIETETSSADSTTSPRGIPDQLRLHQDSLETGSVGRSVDLDGWSRVSNPRLAQVVPTPSELSLIKGRLPGVISPGSAGRQWFTQVSLTPGTPDGTAFQFAVWLHIPQDWQLDWAREYSFSGDYDNAPLNRDFSTLGWLGSTSRCFAGGPPATGYKWRAWLGDIETLPQEATRLANRVNLRGNLSVPIGENLGTYDDLRVVSGIALDTNSDGVPDTLSCSSALGSPIEVQDLLPIVVDHTSVGLFESIPENYLQAAAALDMFFMDRSVGENISDGLDCLSYPTDEDAPNHCVRAASYDASDLNWSHPGGYDRTNWDYQSWPSDQECPDWSAKGSCFVNVIDPMINQYDVVSYQLSYLSVDDGSSVADLPGGFFSDNPGTFDVYDLEAYEAQHPNQTFIYWTTSLARSIGTATSESFNAQMRDYAIEHGKPLFDVADILSHDPDGNPCFDNRDGVTHPDDGVDRLAICQQYTTEVEGGHLGSVSIGKIRVAKAFWVLMARIAGWSG